MDYWFSIGPYDDDYEEPLPLEAEDVTPEDLDPEEDDEDRDAPATHPKS